MIIREYRWKVRARKLLNIKKDCFELVLSRQEIANNVCLPIVFQANPQQFLDVATNRIREAVFFNAAEQKIFKDCFSSPQRLSQIEKIARNPLNKWRRIEAILSLGYAQEASVLSTLKKSINDRDKDIVYFAIIALGQIRNLDSAKILLNFSKKSRIYQYKIFAVLEAFPAEIAEEAIKLTLDRDPEVRAWAVKLISRLKPEQYLKNIEALTQDKSEEVRAAACACLGEFSRKEIKQTLVKCLGDNYWLVRAHAIRVFAKVFGKESLAQIIGCINDPSLSVIDSLKSALIEHIDAAAPYLEKFLQGNDEISRRTSLEVLGVSGYIVKLMENILSGNEEEKSQAMRILEGLIVLRAFSGLEGGLISFSAEKREKLLGIIRKIDPDLAGLLENSIASQEKKA